MKALLFSSVFSTILGGNASVCCHHLDGDFAVEEGGRFFFMPNFCLCKSLNLRLMLSCIALI